MNFKVGDVCILIRPVRKWEDYSVLFPVGTECVIESLVVPPLQSAAVGGKHDCVISVGGTMISSPFCALQKKPPKPIDQTIVTWASCVWRPTGVAA